MATVIRWISEVPESARTDRHDVSLLLGILMGLEGQAAGAEDLLGRVATLAGSSHGRAGLCPGLPRRAGPVASPPRRSPLDMAIRALDMLDHIGDDPLPTIMNLTHPASLETMAVLSRGRAAFPSGGSRAGSGLARAGAGDPRSHLSDLEGQRPGLARAARGLVWAIPNEPSRCQTKRWPSPRKSASWRIRRVAEAYLTSTLVALERGEPGQRLARPCTKASLRAEANGRSQLSWFGHLETALLLEADGKREQAMTTVLSARNDLGAPPPPVVADRLLALQGRLLRLGGSPEQSQRLLRNATSDSAVAAHSNVAAAALALGDHDLGTQIGRRRSRIDRLRPNPLAMVDGLLLTAWLAESEGSPDDARRHLDEALAVAESHSLVESFVRAGPAIVRMVSDLPRPVLPFASRILRRAQALASPSLGERSRRAADGPGARDPLVPAEPAHQHRARRPLLRLGEHDQDPHGSHLPEARRRQSQWGHQLVLGRSAFSRAV